MIRDDSLFQFILSFFFARRMRVENKQFQILHFFIFNTVEDINEIFIKYMTSVWADKNV